MALVSRINMLEKENLKLILIKKDDKENNNNNRCYLLHRKRDYQLNTLDNINNIKNNEEKESLNILVDMMDPKDRIALVLFDQQAKLLYDLNYLDKRTKNKLKI